MLPVVLAPVAPPAAYLDEHLLRAVVHPVGYLDVGRRAAAAIPRPFSHLRNHSNPLGR